ncbi:hypothetical protein JL721_807 [Aureococcus anophagefferens]|nr:hypothetical protein JL721_807 [Aureococcus anophagefferens]
MALSKRDEIELRGELASLSYDLPLGSTSLVKALVDDLQSTTQAYSSLQAQEETLSGELSSLQGVVVPLRKENARLVRESNALHGELLRKAEQHFDADAAERDAHVSTRRALTEARYLLKKHKIPFGYDEGAAGAEVGADEDADAAALRLRVGELEARRADDEKVRDRLVFLAEEREKELARLNGLVASGATATAGSASALAENERVVAALRREVDALNAQVSGARRRRRASGAARTTPARWRTALAAARDEIAEARAATRDREAADGEPRERLAAARAPSAEAEGAARGAAEADARGRRVLAGDAQPRAARPTRTRAKAAAAATRAGDAARREAPRRRRPAACDEAEQLKALVDRLEHSRAACKAETRRALEDVERSRAGAEAKGDAPRPRTPRRARVDDDARRAKALERSLGKRDAEHASSAQRLQALGAALDDARRAASDRQELLDASQDDLRMMTKENQAVHAELASVRSQLRQATEQAASLDRDCDALRAACQRATVERDDALHVYRATCREKQAAVVGADESTRARQDLEHRLQAALDTITSLEGALTDAKRENQKRATVGGSLERELDAAARDRAVDARTVDALRAEAPSSRHSSPGDRIDALLAQARLAQTARATAAM